MVAPSFTNGAERNFRYSYLNERNGTKGYATKSFFFFFCEPNQPGPEPKGEFVTPHRSRKSTRVQYVRRFTRTMGSEKFPELCTDEKPALEGDGRSDRHCKLHRMEIGLLLPNWDGCPNSYSLRSVVGSGSYSEVVAAWRNDGVFEEAVAIKRCKDIFNTDRMVRGPLIALREISILRCLSDSPHVVTLRDAFRLRPQTQDLFLVFDQAERDLDSLFKSPESSTSLVELYSMAYQLFKGVQHMHHAHIIHRDLKPQNILLFTETETVAGAVLKICDFGMAIVVKDEEIIKVSDSSDRPLGAAEDSGSAMATNSLLNPADEEQLLPTATSMVWRQVSQPVMTRSYRCPEIIQEQDYNSSIDLWSSGCILAELLDTLKVPPGKTPRQRSAIFPATASSHPPTPDPFFGGSSESTSPASGDNTHLDEVPTSDHLKSILTKMGSADKSECCGGEELTQYLKSEVAERNANQALEDLYTDAPKCFIRLLQRLLRLNPVRRATAWEAVDLLESSASELFPEGASPVRRSDLFVPQALPEDFDIPEDIVSPPSNGHVSERNADAMLRKFHGEQNKWCCDKLDKILWEYSSRRK